MNPAETSSTPIASVSCHAANANARSTSGAPYAEQSVLRLIRSIVAGDPSALQELIAERTPMMLGGRPAGLLEWLEAQTGTRVRGWTGGDLIPGVARDLCQDRFCRLPERPDGGIDCRHYYRGFLDHLPATLVEAGRLHPLERNARVLDRFRGYVRRHWRLCLRDAWRREQHLTVAHVYEVSDASPAHNHHVSMRLRVPASIPRSERDAWIDRVFGPVDAHADQAVDRLQTRIDRWISHEMLDRERALHSAVCGDPFGTRNTLSSIEHGWSHEGLARTVAREKANAPERLRASIARLGTKRIKHLVTRIFEDMVSGGYHPASMAREFGLHKSTLTRFAASQWRPGQPGPVPDLWLNTAHVLAAQPRFRHALADLGLESTVSDLTEPPPPETRRV